jgi:NAD-dependent dihydropyrimidine dehydrogenase PreA subunit
MSMIYLKNVTTLELYPSKCTGCGICMEVCPHHVFELQNRKAVIVNRDACMECGACSRNCAFDAITVQAGVGCAAAVYSGLIKGGEPTCGCTKDNNKNCC